MKVFITDAAIDAAIKTADILKVHRVLAHGMEGRHHLVFETSEGQAKVLETFSDEVRGYYLEGLRRSTRAVTSRSADSASIKIQPTMAPSWGDPLSILPISEAIDVLDERLGIFVENAENDWYFLCGLMRKSERTRVQSMVAKGWVEPLHGGGSSLRGLLEARLMSQSKGLRTFVVFDSDRLHPDEHLHNWSPTREGRRPAACQAYEWERFTQSKMPKRYWMLHRRYIESYMPKGELEIAAGPNTHPLAIEALYALPKETRWFFNMKDGLQRDARRDDAERGQQLFSSLTEVEKEALKAGFSSNLANHYQSSLSAEFDWDADALNEAATALPRLMRLF